MKTRQIDYTEALAGCRRVHGRLGGLIHMIEEGRGSAEVLTLLAAITHALHRVGYRMVAEELEHCLNDPEGCDQDGAARLEKLFLALG